jgi:hypothetical protein
MLVAALREDVETIVGVRRLLTSRSEPLLIVSGLST